MKLANWKRLVLGALVALSVAGASLATFSARDAAAAYCYYDILYHRLKCVEW